MSKINSEIPFHQGRVKTQHTFWSMKTKNLPYIRFMYRAISCIKQAYGLAWAEWSNLHPITFKFMLTSLKFGNNWASTSRQYEVFIMSEFSSGSFIHMYIFNQRPFEMRVNTLSMHFCELLAVMPCYASNIISYIFSC